MKRLSRFLAVALAATLAACSSSTMIQSNVPGAKVYLDGALVGTAPYAMSDTKIVGSTTAVRIEAPGYAPMIGMIKRDEEFSVGACIGGVFLLVPLLWVMGYKPVHTFELQPDEGGAGGGERPPVQAITSSAARRPTAATARPASTSPRPGAAGSASDRAEALNREGKARIQVVDFAGAAASFRAAIAIEPDPRYYFNLCYTLHKSGSLREARVACEVVAARSPDAALVARAKELLEQIDRALQQGAAGARPRSRAS